MLTVREINRLLLTGKTVCATYGVAGVEQYGRIIRARRLQGQLQGKLLGSGQWVALLRVQEAR